MKIIIPAYQPDNRVLELIKEIKESSDYDIILVDDGSDPICKPIFYNALAAGCTVLIHEVNKGKGAALKTAFSYLLHHNCNDSIICADCDGQHTWPDIKRLADAISISPASIILGCRKFVGKVPLKSMLGNKITRAVFTLITGKRISDTQTGLRGFSAAMLPWLVQLKGNRYEYEMNQLLEAKKAGYAFHCISIDTIYENNNQGSHFHPLQDSIRVYLPIIKFSLSSVLCGILDFSLLFLFRSILNNLLFAVVGARIVSSLCNFLLNKHLVFDAGTVKKLSTIFKYYTLAVVILACNYLILSFFHEVIGLTLFFSKLLTEGVLFLLSYTVQHKFIFKKNSYE